MASDGAPAHQRRTPPGSHIVIIPFLDKPGASVSVECSMKGEVVYLYAFDVANEIITSRVEEILSEKPFPFEIRMDRTLPKDMPLYKPLAIEPHPLAARLQGAPVRLLIRVYDVGVVTVMMRAAFETGALADLMPFHNPKLENGLTLDTMALKVLRGSLRQPQGFAGGAHGVSAATGGLHGILPHRPRRRGGCEPLAGRTAARRWRDCSPRRRRTS